MVTNTEQSPENALASGPEIFSEVYIRYQEWVEKPTFEKLLSSQTLQRLDESGPFPALLRSDSQFMRYIINSRDESKTQKFGCALLGIAAAFSAVLLVVSLLVSSAPIRVTLWCVAGVCIIGISVLLLIGMIGGDK